MFIESPCPFLYPLRRSGMCFPIRASTSRSCGAHPLLKVPGYKHRAPPEHLPHPLSHRTAKVDCMSLKIRRDDCRRVVCKTSAPEDWPVPDLELAQAQGSGHYFPTDILTGSRYQM
jgi:hypothetical protein